MCTVTFIPGKDTIFLTSNRDEKLWRSVAIIPALYPMQSGDILFPKDADAGGTWVAVHANGNAVVFLNGAFKAHIPKPPYRKSRGLVLLELADTLSPYNTFLDINLHDIEPFTAIVWGDTGLFECRWDGKEKFHKQFDHSIPHIWSSSTLYDDAVIQKRKLWFEQWLADSGTITQEDILHFHEFTGDGDCNNDLKMNREGKVCTVSVTSISISEDAIYMHYLDLQLNQSFLKEMKLAKSMAGR